LTIINNIIPEIGVFGMDCPKCGYANKVDAKFCKQCGIQLKKGLVQRFNNEINLLAVFVGLAVSVLVLILGSILYGSVAASGTIDIYLYVGLVLVSMVFIGSIITGILGGHEFFDGAINGAFLSLVTLVIIGFVVGIAIFIAMGILATLASLFNSLGTSSAPSTPAMPTSDTTSDSLEPLFIIIKGLVIIILVFISGGLGGSFGVFLKNGVNKLRNK
jgi:zinc-ribbon domain